MNSFLGVPILIRGEGRGNLYLAEKEGGGEFTDEDEEAVVILAQWAATAIDNARLLEGSERRRQQLEQAVRSLEAARDIADAISGTSDLERVLELVAKRGRALVDARSVLDHAPRGRRLGGRSERGTRRRSPRTAPAGRRIYVRTSPRGRQS